MTDTPGRIIRLIRLIDFGGTQQNLSEILSVSKSTISAWEKDNCPATWQHLAVILSRAAPERREQLIQAILDYEPPDDA